jgi:hypothetical protein
MPPTRTQASNIQGDLRTWPSHVGEISKAAAKFAALYSGVPAKVKPCASLRRHRPAKENLPSQASQKLPMTANCLDILEGISVH